MSKYITINNGRFKEAAAITESAGAGDAGKIPALDSGGKLPESMVPAGFGADVKVIPCSENLSAGDIINVWNDSGTAKARKADATAAGKEAHGFVKAAVISGNNATVYFDGTISGLSSLTPGALYVLSTTAGGIVLGAAGPTSTGNISQAVGFALSATELSFEPGEPVTLA